MKVCHKHGARKKDTILRGKDHPRYKHGEATQEARAEYSRNTHELRKIEDIAFKCGIMSGTRTLGRKPKSDN